MDFKTATERFADRGFDGDPVQIYQPNLDESPVPPDDGDSADTIIKLFGGRDKFEAAIRELESLIYSAA